MRIKSAAFCRSLSLAILTAYKMTDNSTRQLILAKIRQEIINVKENESLLQELEKWKEKWIANWDATGKIKEMLEQVQSRQLLL